MKMKMAKNIKITHEAEDASKEIHKFGKYHAVQFSLVCLTTACLGATLVNYIFVAEDIDHRCRVPECEDESSTTLTPSWWPNDTDPKCFKPVIDRSEINDKNFICSNITFLPEAEPCQDWIYESNSSIVAEFNLGCQSWKTTLVGSVRNSAMIFSMVLAGWLTDKVGRKPAVILYSVGGFIGVIKTIVPNYYTYVAVEFLESFCSSGLLTASVVLLIEIGGESKRVLTGVMFSYSTYVGEFIFAILAMNLRHWRHLILAINIPFLLFLSYIMILKESVRWQMIKGKISDVKDTLKVIVRMNKINVELKAIDNMSDEELRLMFNIEIHSEKESTAEILRSKEIMTRLFVTSFCFFTSAFIYCGLLVHAVYLPGNKYMNFALSAVASFPGELIALYSFNKFGRRISLQSGYFVAALFILVQAFVCEDLWYIKLILFLIGKFGTVVSFTGIYTYSLELFPTSVRGTLVGCGNTCARVGGMLAPLTPLLTSDFPALPAILFASCACLAGLCLTMTPETRTMPMFDTIAQVEANKNKLDIKL